MKYNSSIIESRLGLSANSVPFHPVEDTGFT